MNKGLTMLMILDGFGISDYEEGPDLNLIQL